MIGDVYFDREFRFEDGATGPKLFVVLDGPVDTTTVLIVKTTGQPARYSRTSGCNSRDRFLNFHIPSEARLFDTDTWIQLEAFYERPTDELLQGRFAGRVDHKFTLPLGIQKDLLDCAVGSDDLSPDVRDRIVRARESLE